MTSLFTTLEHDNIGLDEFLAQMKTELSTIVEKKSKIFDYNFEENLPFNSPKRFDWMTRPKLKTDVTNHNVLQKTRRILVLE